MFQGISSRITNNVLDQFSGPWVTVATQLSGDNLKYSYWGSTAALQSQHYCLFANDQWLVQVLEAQLN